MDKPSPDPISAAVYDVAVALLDAALADTTVTVAPGSEHVTAIDAERARILGAFEGARRALIHAVQVRLAAAYHREAMAEFERKVAR